MMFYIALGVSVLLFGFLAYLVSKVWLASHVVLLSFVFIFSMLFMVLAAMSLRTQDAWRKQHDKLASQLEQTETDIEQLQYSNAVRGEELSLPAAKAELGRVMIDRGRIWRGVQPVDAQGTGFVLSMSEWGDKNRVAANLDQVNEMADPSAEAQEGDAPAAANPHGIPEGAIVHAFIEAPLPEPLGPILFPEDSILATERAAVCKLPIAYVGKYRVTASAEASITVEPIVPLDVVQTDAINAGGATWALYELLPQDSHSAFHRKNADGELVKMEPEQIGALFPRPSGELAQQLLQESLEQFVRDQGPATDNDPPEVQRVKVRFVQSHTVEVDLEEETQESARSYDAFGRAVLNQLKQGEPTEFAEGDVSSFDYETANKLVRELGVAEFVDEPAIYHRPLRNYDLELRQRADGIADLSFQAAETQKKVAAAQHANQLAQAQIAYRQEEIQKLKSDKDQFESEQQVVSVYLTQLKQRRESQLKTLSDTYRQNLALRNSMGASRGMFFQGSLKTAPATLADTR